MPTVRSSDLPETSSLVRTHRSVFVLLFSFFVFVGCQEDTASFEDNSSPSEAVDVSKDPAVVEIAGILADYRARAIVAGIDGDDVFDALASDDPHALSRRIGYTDDEIAARDARMAAALADLEARFGPIPPGSREGDGGAAFAAWLDGSPSLEVARRPVVMLCEVVGLVRDATECVNTNPFGTDAMYSCIVSAVCANCWGFNDLCG